MILSVITAGFIFSLFYNNHLKNLVYGFFLTAALFACGMLLYTLEKDSISHLKSEHTVFVGTLSDYPEEKSKSHMLTVSLNSKISPGNSEAVKGSMIIYNRKDSLTASYLPGDMLIIGCTPVEITNRGNPHEFDYRFYLENHGINYYAFTSSSDIISHTVPSHRKITHRALIIREKIIGMYKARGITGERLALVAAITLGQKNMLDPEQKQSFMKAGIMHIMAVSGLHAGILSLFVFNILFFLRGKLNIIRILVTILILWSFAFVTGLTPSVLRATLMLSFLHAGNLMKRRVNGINSVLASAFVLILIRPSVIFDAGFLLSYSAVIYIISFYRELYQKIHFKSWIPDKIWQSAVVTIVAQAGTLPLTIMLFNRFPTYFIISNILVVPLSSTLIITGCLVPLLFPFKFLSEFLALLLNYIAGLTELLTKEVSSLPSSTIENIGMTNAECILLTVTIFLFMLSLQKDKKYSPFFFLTALGLFVVAGAALDLTSRITNELIVYNTPGFSTIGIKTGKTLNLYADTTLQRTEVLKHCSTEGLKLKSNLIENNPVCLVAGKNKIMICSSPDDRAMKKFMPDIVIITGPKLNDTDPFTGHSADVLVFTSKMAAGYRIPGYYYSSDIDTVHLVSKSGAFKMRI